MTERVEARTANSKLIELGGNQYRRSISVGAPIHYLDGAGKLQDIDLAARMDRGQYLIDKAPYALRIDPNVLAYRYTSATRGAVEVELIDPAASGAAQEIDGAFVWPDIGKDTDYRLVPRKWGVAALTVLKSADAPKQWSWRVSGETGLLQPVSGFDAKGQICEIEQETTDGVLTARWTGRVTTRLRLRADPGTAWDAEPVYPVTIDPTINEAVAADADDAWSISGATTFQYLAGIALKGGIFNGAGRLYAVGARFQTVGVPAAATIDSATLSVQVTSQFGLPSLRVYADDVDDAAAWGTGSRITNITKTTAFAAFAPTSNGVKSIDVTTVVAEIVARGGWASNNDIRFGIFDALGAGTAFVTLAAREHTTAQEPRLDITYSVASGQPYIKRVGGIYGMRGPSFMGRGGGVW